MALNVQISESPAEKKCLQYINEYVVSLAVDGAISADFSGSQDGSAKKRAHFKGAFGAPVEF